MNFPLFTQEEAPEWMTLDDFAASRSHYIGQRVGVSGKLMHAGFARNAIPALSTNEQGRLIQGLDETLLVLILFGDKTDDFNMKNDLYLTKPIQRMPYNLHEQTHKNIGVVIDVKPNYNILHDVYTNIK